MRFLYFFFNDVPARVCRAGGFTILTHEGCFLLLFYSVLGGCNGEVRGGILPLFLPRCCVIVSLFRECCVLKRIDERMRG